MSEPTAEDLVRLGRIALASLAGYVLILGFLFLRPPALPVGKYDERGHDSERSMAEVSTKKPDLDSETVGTLHWYRSYAGPGSLEYSMRRHGKVDGEYRYDLYAPGKTGPVGYADTHSGWVIITLAEEPSKHHWMKSDQPTWSSWAE